MKPGDIYSAEETDPKAEASEKNFQGPIVPPGQVVRIEFMAVVDFTTAAKTMSLGYKRGNVAVWVAKETLGSGVYGKVLHRNLILVGGERPIARVTTPTASDVLYFTVRGVFI